MSAVLPPALPVAALQKINWMNSPSVTPTVSVVMAVYNGARYVRQAIDSILDQTFAGFELVIVDDGSTDETPHILHSYQDTRLVLVKNEQNLGLARSLNRGIQVSQAKYIARQDADDISYPQRLETQVAVLDAHPEIGAVGTGAKWVDDNSRMLQVWPPPSDNAEIQQTLLRYCCLIHGSTMYRRCAVEELGGYDIAMRTGQDYDLWLRMSETWDLACLPDVLYVFRRHKDTASLRCEKEQVRNAGIGLDRAIERRLGYARLALGLGCDRAPARLCAMSRRQLAQRYVWWSAGAGELSRKLALQFLLIALLLDPTATDIWSHLRGILTRKIVRMTKG
jgi:glycosyltransferase involved in cell wall biosynthesis